MKRALSLLLVLAMLLSFMTCMVAVNADDAVATPITVSWTNKYYRNWKAISAEASYETVLAKDATAEKPAGYYVTIAFTATADGYGVTENPALVSVTYNNGTTAGATVDAATITNSPEAYQYSSTPGKMTFYLAVGAPTAVTLGEGKVTGTYTVTYDVDETKAEPYTGVATYTPGANLVIATPTAKEEYAFTGWSFAYNDNGLWVDFTTTVGDPVSKSDDAWTYAAAANWFGIIKLTANFADKYTVTYNIREADAAKTTTETPAVAYYIAGDEIALPALEPVDGYNFRGWVLTDATASAWRYPAKGCATEAVSAETTGDWAGNLVATAYFETRSSLTVKANAEDVGTVTYYDDPKTTAAFDALNLTTGAAPEAPAGYRFNGWSIAYGTGGGSTVEKGDAATGEYVFANGGSKNYNWLGQSPIVATATYKANTYTLYYNFGKYDLYHSGVTVIESLSDYGSLGTWHPVTFKVSKNVTINANIAAVSGNTSDTHFECSCWEVHQYDAVNDVVGDAVLVDGEPMTVADGEVLDTSSLAFDVVLVAKWEAKEEYRYTITYDAGVGTVESTTQAYSYGTTFTLATPNAPGWTFDGWEVTVQPEGSSWTKGHKLTAEELLCTDAKHDGGNLYGDVTLTALYTVKPYTLTYAFGIGSATSTNYTQNGTYYVTTTDIILPIMEQKVTKSGTEYQFKGWEATCTAEGNWPTGTFTTLSQDTGLYGNVTLKAVYAPLYTLTYNSNGKTVKTGTLPAAAKIDGAVKVTTNKLTADNFTFLGWSTDPKATQATYAAGNEAGETIELTKDTTLYAIWATNAYTVVFHSNTTSKDDTVKQTIAYGSAAALTANSFTWDGYDFTGWALTTKGTVAYKDKASISLTKDKVQNDSLDLYAIWTASTKVTFTLTNAATAKNTATTYTVGKDYTATLTANDKYVLPAAITVKLGTTTLDASQYSYNGATGVVKVNASVLKSGSGSLTIEAKAEAYTAASNIRVIYSLGSGLSVKTGAAVATYSEKASSNKYTATLAAGTGYQLPTGLTVSLMSYYNEKSGINLSKDTAYTDCEFDYSYDASKGTLSIVVDDIIGDYDDDEFDYILVSADAVVNGKVDLSLVTTSAGKNTTTKTTGLTLDEALTKIDETAKATAATITLKGNVETSNRIIVAEDFDLTITGDYTLTSKYTYTKSDVSRDCAITLKDDATLDLDVAALCYAESVAVYSTKAEEDVSDDYGIALVCTDKDDKVVNNYLVQTVAGGISAAAAAMKANSKITAATMEVAKDVTLTDAAVKNLAKGMELVLADGVTLTANKKLDEYVVSGVEGEEVVITEKNGKYSHAVGLAVPEIKEEEKKAEEPAPVTFTVTASGTTGGTVSPAILSDIAKNTTVQISIVPDAGYKVSKVTINGTSFNDGILTSTAGGYVLSQPVTKDTSIVVTFAPNSFPDVPSTEWYAGYVNDVVAQGLMVGDDYGNFLPEENMTVGQYLTVMYRYIQDLAPSAVASKSTTGINWTEAAQYVNDELFNNLYTDLYAAASRYDIAHITSTVLQTVSQLTSRSYGYGSALTYKDVPSTDPYFADVTYLSTVGILNGYYTNGVRTYQGSNNMKRCEIAKVLSCLLALN